MGNSLRFDEAILDGNTSVIPPGIGSTAGNFNHAIQKVCRSAEGRSHRDPAEPFFSVSAPMTPNDTTEQLRMHIRDRYTGQVIHGFFFFPLPPKEIRSLVWELTLAPQVIHWYRSQYDLRDGWYIPPFRRMDAMVTPVAFYVNRESRKLALYHYVPSENKACKFYSVRSDVFVIRDPVRYDVHHQSTPIPRLFENWLTASKEFPEIQEVQMENVIWNAFGDPPYPIGRLCG
ncbi:hypothetical protein BOTCAL_0991g00010 [Botryotinia calthae]|uniref:2EXR domain-containing protein n=1 Tax=Botryotinia calthae TaxID=38488 RepID=A0A4Y8CGG1_9HELO|nr:hypothetical protein BOTCAL_0991g00010 [Botryotinia calthae]